MEKNLKSITLAGGFGTRLGKIGTKIPKGLIKSSGGTVIDRLFRDLNKDTRIEDKVIVTNDRFYSNYSSWLSRTGLEESVTLLNNKVNDSEKRLGAIGDLIFALNEMGWIKTDIDILVSPCDTLYKFKISDFLDFCENIGEKGLYIVVSSQSRDAIQGRLGCAILEGNRVIGFEEKPEDPKSEFAAVPFYLYSRITNKISEYIRSGGKIDAPSSTIPWLIENDIPVFAFKTSGTLDVGTPDDLQKAEMFGKMGD